MMKTSSQDKPGQLSLFNELEAEMDDRWLNDDFGFDEESDRDLEPVQRELLTLKLLREAINTQNPDDKVMQDFAEYVLPNLLRYAIGVTAKGGKFFDELDRQRESQNRPKAQRNRADQSLNTHLLNGLFPANLIEQRLEKLDTTVQRYIGEKERRLVIAAFILHDFEKFPNTPEDCRKRPLSEQREIFNSLLLQLGIDRFIDPENSDTYLNYLDDLLCIAYNTQKRWGTNWNFSEYGLSPLLRDRTLVCLCELTCLADRLASIVKHPQDADNSSLDNILHSLSDGQLKFTYHAIAENRGVLTNVVNNALMEAHQALNTAEKQYYTPLLYLPTGVIYLASKNAPAIALEELPQRAIANIKSLCGGQLRLRQTGFGRDGKGMKYAEYYNLFFDAKELMQVALDATLRILRPTKNSVAKSRSDNLIEFQNKEILPPNIDFTFEDDIRIDQLAEFGDVISRKVWGDRLEWIQNAQKGRKKQKSLPALPSVELTEDDIIHHVAEFLGLAEHSSAIRAIQHINESLKEKKLKGNTGGVPYEWYYLAAQYIRGSGIEDIREVAKKIIDHLASLIQPILAQYEDEIPDSWEDIHLWLERVVMLPGKQAQAEAQTEVFLKELSHYTAAKKPGRGRQLICSLSHSPYDVSEQMESAVLFTPQVYTNKQHLGGSNAKRNISSIARIEMMLRQILMNQTQAVGKRFEDGKYRYLYFYPTYYFTPETNTFLQRAYNDIAQTRFDASIRNHFIKDFQANLTREHYQSVDSFLIDEELQSKKNLAEDDPNFKRDRTFKLSYPEDKPLTFYFMALPPGREPTDTESWVMPAWLAFAFPMILDVKTVVSESPIPPFNDGAEFEETVFLDSAPQAIRTLVKRDRFRLDYILEGWEDDNGIKYSAPLNALTAAYAIHLDVNAKQAKGGYDANWGKLTELAKDLETSPLYVFSYLAKWARGQQSDAPNPKKIALYARYFYPCFDPDAEYDHEKEEWKLEVKSPLNHPKKLVELYRVFYKANECDNPKANAVLKPIVIASDAILKADMSMFHGQALVAVVAAEVTKLMDRVDNSTAKGRLIFTNREEERQAVLEFARYFVEEVFEKTFAGDRARLAGRQINLIRDTCEFLYRLEEDRENQEQKAKGETVEAETNN